MCVCWKRKRKGEGEWRGNIGLGKSVCVCMIWAIIVGCYKCVLPSASERHLIGAMGHVVSIITWGCFRLQWSLFLTALTSEDNESNGPSHNILCLFVCLLSFLLPPSSPIISPRPSPFRSSRHISSLFYLSLLLTSPLLLPSSPCFSQFLSYFMFSFLFTSALFCISPLHH